MNPFVEEKKDFTFSPAEAVRELFSDKKEGDTFEVPLDKMSAKIARATIYQVVKQKYKTKMKNGKLYVLIIAGQR